MTQAYQSSRLFDNLRRVGLFTADEKQFNPQFYRRTVGTGVVVMQKQRPQLDWNLLNVRLAEIAPGQSGPEWKKKYQDILKVWVHVQQESVHPLPPPPSFPWNSNNNVEVFTPRQIQAIHSLIDQHLKPSQERLIALEKDWEVIIESRLRPIQEKNLALEREIEALRQASQVYAEQLALYQQYYQSEQERISQLDARVSEALSPPPLPSSPPKKRGRKPRRTNPVVEPANPIASLHDDGKEANKDSEAMELSWPLEFASLDSLQPGTDFEFLNDPLF